MDIAAALAAFGVVPGSTTATERAALDRDGFVVLDGVLAPDEVAALNDTLAALAAAEGAAAGAEVHQEPGTVRLANLVDKVPDAMDLVTNPRLLGAVAHVLDGDLKLSSLNARAALPGTGLQPLHCDWHEPVSGTYQVCNAIWLLDDFTEINGATRVVPGSHHWSRLPEDALADPSAPHPDEVLLIAPAGTVVVFNSHVWHGGTTNHSSSPRRAAHSYFTRRNQPQQTEQRRWLSPSRAAALSTAERVLLDVP